METDQSTEVSGGFSGQIKMSPKNEPQDELIWSYDIVVVKTEEIEIIEARIQWFYYITCLMLALLSLDVWNHGIINEPGNHGTKVTFNAFALIGIQPPLQATSSRLKHLEKIFSRKLHIFLRNFLPSHFLTFNNSEWNFIIYPGNRVKISS